MTSNGSLDRLERYELQQRVLALEAALRAQAQQATALEATLRHLHARVKRLTDWVEERSLAE